MSNQFSSFIRKNLFFKTQFLHCDILYLLRQYILTRGLTRGGRERGKVAVWGEMNRGCSSYLHCIATSSLRGPVSLNAPGVHRVSISMQPRADPRLAPSRLLFPSVASHLVPSSGGTSWNALKIHCESLGIDPGRAIRTRMCTGCARIIRFRHSRTFD